MVLISLTLGLCLHPCLWAEEPDFSSAQGLQSPPELCRRTAGLQLSHSPVLPGHGLCDRDPHLKNDFLAWSQPCLITMNLPDDLDSWLSLAAISGSVLPCSPCLGTVGLSPGWQDGCPAGWTLCSAPTFPSLREQPALTVHCYNCLLKELEKLRFSSCSSWQRDVAYGCWDHGLSQSLKY